MTMLAVDYSWTHPDPGAIRRAGYSGVLRYLSGVKGKDITAAEIMAVHRAGLWVSLVWETTAKRAGEGAKAGAADRAKAEKMAKALGYPSSCVIFYAVDYDAVPSLVMPYFNGALDGARYHVGVYGSLRVTDYAMARHVGYGWQTSAWSGGAVSPHAHVYQRQHPTKAITGARGAYDEDVILHPFPVWGPKVTVAPKPAPKPPAPPHPANPDHDLVVAFQKWEHAKGLTG